MDFYIPLNIYIIDLLAPNLNSYGYHIEKGHLALNGNYTG